MSRRYTYPYWGAHQLPSPTLNPSSHLEDTPYYQPPPSAPPSSMQVLGVTGDLHMRRQSSESYLSSGFSTQFPQGHPSRRVAAHQPSSSWPVAHTSPHGPPPLARPLPLPLSPLSQSTPTLHPTLAYPSTVPFDLANIPCNGLILQLRAELASIPAPPVGISIEFPSIGIFTISTSANAVLEVIDGIHNSLHDSARTEYENLPPDFKQRVYASFKRRILEYGNTLGIRDHRVVWKHEGPKLVDLLCGTTQFMGLSHIKEGVWRLVLREPAGNDQ